MKVGLPENEIVEGPAALNQAFRVGV